MMKSKQLLNLNKSPQSHRGHRENYFTNTVFCAKWKYISRYFRFFTSSWIPASAGM